MRHDLGIRVADAGQEFIGPLHRVSDAPFRIGAQSLDAVRDAAELGGQDSGIVEDGVARGNAARIVQQSLQGLREGVQGRVERPRPAGRSEELVELCRVTGPQRRIGAAGGLEPALLLDQDVEHPLHFARAHAGRAIARHLLDRLHNAPGVAGGVGVRDILRDEIDVVLRRPEAGDRSVERHHQSHGAAPSNPR